jgi:hypothetical protein
MNKPLRIILCTILLLAPLAIMLVATALHKGKSTLIYLAICSIGGLAIFIWGCLSD